MFTGFPFLIHLFNTISIVTDAACSAENYFPSEHMISLPDSVKVHFVFSKFDFYPISNIRICAICLRVCPLGWNARYLICIFFKAYLFMDVKSNVKSHNKKATANIKCINRYDYPILIVNQN